MTTTGQAPDHSPNNGKDEPASRAPAAIEVRHLKTHQEFVDCVALQHQIWGAGFSERVPAAILKVSQRIGGVTAGAFDSSGDIVGFVFGLTGVEDHELVHWSDMLAVRADLRDHGIGRILKEFQMRTLLERGVARIYWTFDPLVARNAHLNFNRLGVRVADYVPDMYGGQTDSALHRGLGTDRFIVVRPIAASNGEPLSLDHDRMRSVIAAGSHAPILNAVDSTGTPSLPELPSFLAEPTLRIAIPLEIDKVQSADLAVAARWRETTRAAILWGIAQDYRVLGFYRDDAAQCGFYVLSAAPRSSSPASSASSRASYGDEAV